MSKVAPTKAKGSTRKKRATKSIYDPKRRNANRKALRHARALALVEGEIEENMDPAYALQYVLDRTFHMLRKSVEAVSTLEPAEVWRDTLAGRIPNEWIRLEQELRKEAFQISSRMLDLDIDDRRVRASEMMAAVIAPVLEGVLEELNLTKEQRKKAPKVVEANLKLLEAA